MQLVIIVIKYKYPPPPPPQYIYIFLPILMVRSLPHAFCSDGRYP